ncbi:hypothetical protein HK100_001959 [Physocladia obscura]|uniref:Uncharacterized protein n=1 Tax=Physocladia obscura TaxID=109957 RepID=A0AAD5XAN3_9FUNG|nr:hypothetical protein HK100_001959 [Physocladia obscura]
MPPYNTTSLQLSTHHRILQSQVGTQLYPSSPYMIIPFQFFINFPAPAPVPVPLSCTVHEQSVLPAPITFGQLNLGGMAVAAEQWDREEFNVVKHALKNPIKHCNHTFGASGVEIRNGDSNGSKIGQNHKNCDVSSDSRGYCSIENAEINSQSELLSSQQSNNVRIDIPNNNGNNQVQFDVRRLIARGDSNSGANNFSQSLNNSFLENHDSVTNNFDDLSVQLQHSPGYLAEPAEVDDNIYTLEEDSEEDDLILLAMAIMGINFRRTGQQTPVVVTRAHNVAPACE